MLSRFTIEDSKEESSQGFLKNAQKAEREQRLDDEEIDDDVDDTLEINKPKSYRAFMNLMMNLTCHQMDNKDSLDSDKTLSDPRLDVFNEGDEDDALNFTTLVPSLEDVGLPKITGTSRLKSYDRSSRKENPSGDSVDLDRLTESQTVIILKISLTTSPAMSSNNITIPQLKERLYEMMINNPESIQGDINNDLYIALSKSIEQGKQAAPTKTM
nr:hypothetical protein [Tanacetum cinerariifolium]